MSTHINEDSIEVFYKLLMNTIEVNPDARPALLSLIETLLDNNVPQECWGTIFFRVWQGLRTQPS